MPGTLPSRIAFALTVMIAAIGPTLADDLRFPADQFGRADLGVPQSLESMVLTGSSDFEDVDDFSYRNRYRLMALPIGRLDLLIEDATGQRFVSVCTAWLISDTQALTNHHCLPGATPVAAAQRGADGQSATAPRRTVRATLRLGYLAEVDRPGKLFDVRLPAIEADPVLDYAIVEVAGNPAAEFGFVPLNPRDPVPGEELVVVHHPAGRPLRLTRVNCRASAQNTFTEADLRHRCATLVGSSGAPIFSDNDGAVVGLHYLGGLDENESSFNSAKRLQLIVQRSPILAALATAPPTVEPGVSAGRAPGPPTQACDRLSAHPDDPARSTAGVWWSDIDPARAVEACRAAIGNYPDTPRFKFQLGRALDRSGAVKEAIGWYRQAAQDGYAQSQFNLGRMYEDGRGVLGNITEAARWYRRAADQGHHAATTALRAAATQIAQTLAPTAPEPHVPLVHECDLRAAHPDDARKVSAGVTWERIDPAAATQACRQAVDAYPLEPRFKFQYARALDRARDVEEAVKWYEIAAKTGYPQAQYNLGSMYRSGRGTVLNPERAARWYLSAAERGSHLAILALIDLARQDVIDARQALADLGLE